MGAKAAKGKESDAAAALSKASAKVSSAKQERKTYQEQVKECTKVSLPGAVSLEAAHAALEKAKAKMAPCITKLKKAVEKEKVALKKKIAAKKKDEKIKDAQKKAAGKSLKDETKALDGAKGN